MKEACWEIRNSALVATSVTSQKRRKGIEVASQAISSSIERLFMYARSESLFFMKWGENNTWG